MKSSQLANVLIKIIGLYVCLCAIPGLVSGLIAILMSTFGMPKPGNWLFTELSFSIGAAVQVVAGIILIAKSRNLADFWFKSEEE